MRTVRGGAGDDERGSSPVEFVLVGTMLKALTLAVLQLALIVYVRNVVHDAAVEGAYYAALADTAPVEGVERARQVITRAVGAEYADDVSARVIEGTGRDVVAVRVRTSMPILGLIGIPAAWEVEARAPRETFDE